MNQSVSTQNQLSLSSNVDLLYKGNTGYIGDFPPYTYTYPQYDYCWPIIQPIIKESYPVYIQNWQEKNKTEQAFKILQKLVEKKIVKLETVKDFIDTVNTIAEAL